MMCYSVQLRDQIFIKGYGFLYFAKNMSKSIGKNISINLTGKYSQIYFDHTKQFATDAFKTVSKRAIQKTAEATGDLIGNKIADKITGTASPKDVSVSKNSNKKLPEEDVEIITQKKDTYLQKKGNRLLMN